MFACKITGENNKEESKMKKITIMMISAVLAALLIFTSCTQTADNTGMESTGQRSTSAVTTYSADPETDTAEDPTDDSKQATGDFTVTPGEGASDVTSENGVYTVISAGEYTLSGSLTNGQGVVDAPDDAEVTLILNGVSVSSQTTSPINVKNAGDVTVRSEEGTYNTVTDERTADPDAVSDEEENDDAAIYSVCDLKISGKGTLIVTSSYDNGIKSKDDLKIKNVTLKVTSAGSALKGNDSVTIESGEIILVSSSDGVKTSNSSISSKENQKGDIVIDGGHVDIYSAQDGLSAAHDVVISETEEASPTVNVFTASYADLASSSSGTDLYLIVAKGTYSAGNDYYAYFYNDEGEGVWKKCEYETMIYSGRTASYYGLLVSVPSSYGNVAFCIFDSGVTPDAENCTAATEGETVNTSMNGYLITDISSGVITGDWVQLSTGSGNSNKTAFSSKGVKAENEITVNGGTLNVYCMDDGLHANAGTALENGSAGVGNVTVNGGTVTVTAADDGIHADNKLCINGGCINIVKSHEGLEGNVIEINGGQTYVCGDDDGVNACKGASTPLVNVTGGYLDVTTPSGDTDGIDSNGNITISGGFIIVKSGAANGGMAGSVDTDGTVTVTGGTVVAFGGVCEVPSGSSVNTYVSSGTTFSAGGYSLKDSSGNEIASFTLSGSYSSVWIASDGIQLNGSYTLYNGTSKTLEWTQTSNVMGYSGGFGGGGFGGFGGFGGGKGGRR